MNFLEWCGVLAIVALLLYIILVPTLAYIYNKGMRERGQYPKLYKQVVLGMLFKWEAKLYLFQGGRWDMGLVYDINGRPLFVIDFIVISIEFEYFGNEEE